MKEKEIEKQILDWLETHSHCMAWKNDTVGIFDPVKKIYRKPPKKGKRKGVSDILGIWNGKPLAIEVKSKTGRLRPDQKEFLAEFEQKGGIAFMARSLDDAIRHLLSNLDQSYHR
jgi:penicillin-binding protein-related factor A (putative recombinase)